jgi:hypothetical protein
MSLSCCRNLGNFGALVFMLWIFVHTRQKFTPLLMLISIRCLICSPYFCTDGAATVLRDQRGQYHLYRGPSLGGFSLHFVGDSQWGWLRYAGVVQGGLLLGPGCSLRPHDRDRATSPRALGVGRLEHDVFRSPWCWVGRVRGHADPPHLVRAAPRRGDAYCARVVPNHGPRMSLTNVLLTTDPPEVIVRQLLRLMEAV